MGLAVRPLVSKARSIQYALRSEAGARVKRYRIASSRKSDPRIPENSEPFEKSGKSQKLPFAPGNYLLLIPPQKATVKGMTGFPGARYPRARSQPAKFVQGTAKLINDWTPMFRAIPPIVDPVKSVQDVAER